MTSIPHYEQHAEQLIAQYESLAFETVHADLLDAIVADGGKVLDVGAGSGRDAAWFAARGYDVVAVEPSDAMRQRAMALHAQPRIRWIKDCLPDLALVRRLGLTFDVILLSAVWMHVPPASRARALRIVATLLAPNGRIAISLRLGEPDAERHMFPVSLHELAALSQQFGLRMIKAADSADRLGRASVTWTTAVLGLPDDGLGALPLLRHLILVDNKASTYKIALLRVLARIADSATGCAVHEEEHVVIPMGLVALFWMRMFKPLIEHDLPQMTMSARPKFVTDSFSALRLVTAVELRAGATFSGHTAKHLQRSLGEIARNIRDMPATFLTWPASDKPIFTATVSRRTSAPEKLTIDDPFLWSFGEFRVPTQIWQALTRYNVWIEPVLVAEWARLIEGYAGDSRPDARERANALLAWADPGRDVALARAAVQRLRAAGKSIFCVWSGQRLPDEFHVDHCFPYAAWPCGDAWNLMPASKKVNGEKSNRLVTQNALERSSERITEWWSDAFLSIGDHARQRFYLEAGQTLPVLKENALPEDVIEAMQIHRMRLAQDQGLRPWEPSVAKAGAVPEANIVTSFP